MATRKRTLPSTYGVITLAIEFAKAEADGQVKPADFERYCRLALRAYGRAEMLILEDEA